MKLASLLAMTVLAAGINSAAAQDLVLAINEGVTYQDGGPASERYKPLLQLLSKELKQNVKLQTVDKYAVFEKGLAEGKYDLAFIHPAHVGLLAVKKNGYEGLVTAKGFTDYRARVMVAQASPLKSMQDLRGKKIGVPSVESITTVMFTANLHELRFPNPEKTYTPTRYQDAVPFMIENGFVDAGVTGSAGVAKAWVAKGGRILGETKPIPIKQFLASKKLSDAEREKVKNLLLNLSENEAGKNALSKIGMTGFVPWNATAMDEATARLGL
ncbi:phosphate/phosphite/phosphonate ABC transporter substrate-binding protein [Herminiimonas arsenitoxidans]|uniref:phosphate/phosphite/phosphonate ABC transporter substrate-binding protein n=1 Tax=Herminiimonas arsenitoxidans TaxID=1809410 RepID=UPI0009708DED|nr:phosphate/phosphite/phosphonate ABC transporter substrate-binding protein [Herminiimonas arsenitoxidans]